MLLNVFMSSACIVEVLDILKEHLLALLRGKRLFINSETGDFEAQLTKSISAIKETTLAAFAAPNSKVNAIC